MRLLNTIAWTANFVGIACGLYVLFVAIDRNHQGEYINDAGALDFGYALQMFVAWYLISALATAIVLSIPLLFLSVLILFARWMGRPNSR